MNQAIANRLSQLYNDGSGLDSTVEILRWSERATAFIRGSLGQSAADDFLRISASDSFDRHAARLGHIEALVALADGQAADDWATHVDATASSPAPPTAIRAPAPSVPAAARRAIVVVAALYEELDRVFDARVLSQFPLPLVWSRHTLKGLKTEYWRADLGAHYELIAITPDSMGLTETAIVATAAFESFTPVLTALLGTCAGRYEKRVRLGHLVVPTQAFHFQFGARTETALEPEIRAESVNPRFGTAAQRIAAHTRFQSWLNEGHPRSLLPQSRTECHVGPMASSDFVAKWDALVTHAASMDRKVVGIDMESYAFLRAAKRCGLANEAFIVKCVVDYADRDKDDQVREWAQVASARFFYFMLARWLDDADHTTHWAKVSAG